MLLFLDEQQEVMNEELEERKSDIFGSCTSQLSNDKATVIVKHKRNLFKIEDENEQLLLDELTGESNNLHQTKK